MAKSQTTLRLNEELLDRADQLIPVIQADEAARGPLGDPESINRSAVLRAAVELGLQRLEIDFGLRELEE